MKVFVPLFCALVVFVVMGILTYSANRRRSKNRYLKNKVNTEGNFDRLINRMQKLDDQIQQTDIAVQSINKKFDDYVQRQAKSRQSATGITTTGNPEHTTGEPTNQPTGR